MSNWVCNSMNLEIQSDGACQSVGDGLILHSICLDSPYVSERIVERSLWVLQNVVYRPQHTLSKRTNVLILSWTRSGKWMCFVPTAEGARVSNGLHGGFWFDWVNASNLHFKRKNPSKQTEQARILHNGWRHIWNPWCAPWKTGTTRDIKDARGGLSEPIDMADGRSARRDDTWRRHVTPSECCTPTIVLLLVCNSEAIVGALSKLTFWLKMSYFIHCTGDQMDVRTNSTNSNFYPNGKVSAVFRCSFFPLYPSLHWSLIQNLLSL